MKTFPVLIMKQRQAARFVLSSPWISLAVVVIVGLIVYSNTFYSPFVFDDEAYIQNSRIVRDFTFFSSPSEISSLSNRMWTIKAQFRNRIVGHFTLWLNYQAHGLDVTGYHIVNLTIHLINSVIVYLFVLLIFRTPVIKNNYNIETASGPDPGKIIALLCALFFVAHPIQTQAVTYLSQRFTCLATLFCLLAILLYGKARLSASPCHRRACFAFSLICVVLAMHTKEISFTLPVILTLYEFTFFHDTMRRRLLRLSPFLLTMSIIPMTLLLSAGPITAIENISKVSMETPAISRIDYLFTQFGVIVTYFSLFFLPLYQNLDYDYPISDSFFLPQVFLPFLFLMSSFLFAIYLFYLSRKKGSHAWIYRLASFGILYFFITLSVESSIIPIKEIMCEHRAYLPSLGMFLAVSSGIILLKLRLSHPLSQIVIPITFIAIIILAAAAHSRNTVWSSEISLLEDAVNKSPMKARTHINLGASYLRVGDISKASREANIALSLEPNRADAHNNLGSCYLAVGALDMAEAHFRKTIDLNPSFYEPYVNLGLIYLKRNRYREAEEWIMRALSIAPRAIYARRSAAGLYEARGEHERAIEAYKSTINIAPDNAEAYNRLGRLYTNLKRYDEAIETYLASARLKPDIASSHVNLGLVYELKGKTDDAEYEYRAALKIEPLQVDALLGLGRVHIASGEKGKALTEFTKVLDLDPNNAEALKHIKQLHEKE
jgi:tetratricopeptide (TPR) repeat protein